MASDSFKFNKRKRRHLHSIPSVLMWADSASNFLQKLPPLSFFLSFCCHNISSILRFFNFKLKSVTHKPYRFPVPFHSVNPFQEVLILIREMGLGKDEGLSLVRDLLRECGGFAVVDGGLATELERHGADLNDPLWSAKCLISFPQLIKRVHLDYLEAGANIIISASYQATLQGFEAKGIHQEEGEALLRKSVEIAREARDTYYTGLDDGVGDNTLKHPILVAASVGSYGAYLADGSEYSGIYGENVTLETLKDFHRRRVQVLDDSGADLIAFETIPNKLEAQAYAEILKEYHIKTPAWFSFNSKDGVNVVSGDPIQDCVAIADSCDRVVSVGINCTPPRFIDGLIQSVQKVTTKPIVIYPNSGETYDPDRKEWVPTTGVSDESFESYVSKWNECGASLIGGCCRTTPNTIRAIHKALCSTRYGR